MAFTDVITTTWASGGDTFSKQVSNTAGGRIAVSEVIPPNSTNVAVTLAIDVSAMKDIVISGSAVMTLKTNSTGSPDNTIVLAADTPLVWTTGNGLTAPLTVDVTILYVTSVAGGTLDIRGLQDVTP